MSCQQPQTPVTLTACNTSSPPNVTDDMIGINVAAKTFTKGDIKPFSATTCAAYPTGYISVVNMVTTHVENYSIPAATGDHPYGTKRDSNGLLSRDSANNQVAIILGKLGICINTSNFEFNKVRIQECNEKDQKFITGVQLECAYYYGLYKYAIKNLAASITCPVTTPAPDYGSWTHAADKALQKYTEAAIILNQMVNDVIYIMDQVAQTRTNIDIASLTTTLNGLDDSLKTTSDKLKTQRDALTSPGQGKMVLYKEMEAYSRQKAAYHNNLLALYSFLNITALGLLFYVYRST